MWMLSFRWLTKPIFSPLIKAGRSYRRPSCGDWDSIFLWSCIGNWRMYIMWKMGWYMMNIRRESTWLRMQHIGQVEANTNEHSDPALEKSCGVSVFKIYWREINGTIHSVDEVLVHFLYIYLMCLLLSVP
jgi:hypothetical protein